MYTRECIQKLTCEGAAVGQVVKHLKREMLLLCRQAVWRIEESPPLTHNSGRLTKENAVLQFVKITMSFGMMKLLQKD